MWVSDEEIMPAPEQGPESEAARAVHEWVDRVFELSGLNIDVRTTETEEQISVGVYGMDAGRLTANDGELLDAVQVLANKALGDTKTEKQIELDAAGFKQRREEFLERKARETAEQVAADGEERLLPAMSPAERRIIHVALRDHASVTTESRGDGFFKRVAVMLRSDAPAADES